MCYNEDMKALLGFIQTVLLVIGIIMFWGQAVWWSVSMLVLLAVEVTVGVMSSMEKRNAR